MINQYVVGGSVRDVLMGRDPKDIDFVWVGATPEYLLSKGFKQVGADFPVFLDSKGQEHALARTEIKIGSGYNGFTCRFDPSITLEDDLFRRDLTCNAMAVPADKWDEFVRTKDVNLVVDPFNGVGDIASKRLRNVSEHFAEDPVRVLRTARFSARYNFDITVSTIMLMTQLVELGELDHLTAERVWLELEKVVKEDNFLRFFEVLEQCGALAVVMPMLVVDYNFVRQVDKNLSSTERFAALTLSNAVSGKAADDFYDHLKAPVHVSRVAKKVKKAHTFYQFVRDRASPALILNILEQIDAFRDTEIIDHVVNVLCHSDAEITALLLECFQEARAISFNSLDETARSSLVGPQIAAAIRQKRIEQITTLVDKYVHEIARN